MIKNVECLHIHPKLQVLAQMKPLRQIEVTPEKLGSSQGIAAQIPKLAILH